MNLKESLGDLMLQSEAAGAADITTVATLLAYARDANYFSSVVLKGPDALPPTTPAAELTASAAVAAAAELAIQIDPAPVVPVQELPPSL